MRLDATKGTFAEQMCSVDPDLKCPEHDRMSFVLADKDKFSCLVKDATKTTISRCNTVNLEYPITKGEGQYKTIVGFIDARALTIIRLMDSDSLTPYESSEECFIEAKPKINNPMEVLRQLNTYKNFRPKGFFILWCPTIDEKTAEIFRSQKIYVSSMKIDELEK